MRRAAGGALLTAVLVASGCTAEPEGAAGPRESPRAETAPVPSTPSQPTDPTESTGSQRPPGVRPADFDRKRAMATVRHLAGQVGPRHGTSPAFRRAAAWVGDELRAAGYDVRRQRFAVPGGTSWGVPVGPGRSLNVVATPRGFDAARPHLVVGAHLDTVPQAPGAEDNASGIGVLLAAAEAASTTRTRLPVVWVAFGAEEPRGPGDDDHHYGSRAYVAELTRGQARAVRGMVSLDRVGVGNSVPVGSASERDPLQRDLLAAGRRAGVPTTPDPQQRSSDHWSFVRAGLPGVRLGSTPYAGYHSAADVPAVVDPAQLARTGRLVLAWLAPSA